MHIEDLKTLSNLSNALWANPQFSERSAIETLSAVALQDLTPERTLEKAAVALVDRAKRGGPASNAQVNLGFLLQRFFRLSVEERVVLVSLHLGHWSYSKLGKILQMSSEQLQEVAWRARLQLISARTYPAAPSVVGPRCPEYDPTRPWTQRYLDNEVPSGRDRIFLQQHLLSCEPCSACFSRCKAVYYEVEKEVVQAVGGFDCVESLQDVMRMSTLQNYPSKITLLESLAIFVKRPDIKWPLAVFMGLSAIFLFNKLF